MNLMLLMAAYVLAVVTITLYVANGSLTAGLIFASGYLTSMLMSFVVSAVFLGSDDHGR